LQPLNKTEGVKMTKAGERKVTEVKSANGCSEFILKEILLSDEQMGEHCGLFGKVTIKPGCELGYHEHHGEGEAYYILKGSGIYSDNGKEIAVTPGDVVFCEDGSGHGLINTGTEDIEFIALILSR